MPRAISPVRVVWAKAILGLAAVGLLVGLGIPFVTRARRNEMEVYVTGAERLAAGEKVHRLPSEGKPNERAFTYPVLFALPFVPTLHWNKTVQGLTWYAANLACLAGIFWVLSCRLRAMLGPSTDRRRWHLLLGCLALLSARHVLAPLENQSHDLFVFLACALAIEMACRSRDALAGSWAGLGAALKCTPLLFAPVFLWQRRWAALAAILIAAGGLTFLPDLLYPANDGRLWIAQWSDTFLRKVQLGASAEAEGGRGGPDAEWYRAWDPWSPWNQSIPGTFHRLFTHVPPEDFRSDKFDIHLVHLDRRVLKLATMAAQLLVAAWLFWICRPRWIRQASEQERATLLFGQGSAVLLAMVLLSPTSIKTHFAVLLFPMAFCLADWLARRDGFVGAVLLVQLLLGTLTAKGLVGFWAGDYIVAYGSVTWCAVALLAATGWIVLRRSQAGLIQAATGPQAEAASRAWRQAG
jgi:hypothetical protein